MALLTATYTIYYIERVSWVEVIATIQQTLQGWHYSLLSINILYREGKLGRRNSNHATNTAGVALLFATYKIYYIVRKT